MDTQAVATIVSALLVAIAGPLLIARIRRRRAERTDVLAFRKPAAIRTFDGKYAHADLSKGGASVGRALDIQKPDVFQLVDPRDPLSTAVRGRIRFGDRVALQALSNRSFVAAELPQRRERKHPGFR